MLELKAKIRKELGKKVKKLREKGIIPAVLYGPKIKTQSLEVELKEFEKIYKEAGESSLIQLLVDKEKFLVLIHAIEIDSLSQKPLHIDFYQPRLDEEITATIPLVIEGEAPAVKELGGTLVRNIHEVEVKAFPQNLPHEIKVKVGNLKTFEDNIQIKDLIVPQGVKILKEPDETVAFVAKPEKVEEELAKPIEEKVEEVEKVEEEKEKEAAPEEGEPRPEESGREEKEK
jgi:large subunit ribosomal protein L25